MTLNKVVLPAPLAPRMASRSPASMANEMPSSAARAPNERPTPSRTRAWVPLAAVSSISAIAASGPASLRTGRGLARRLAGLLVLVLGDAQGLIDLRDHLDDLVVEVAVRAGGDLGQELVADGVAVMVEMDRPGGRVHRLGGERVAELLVPVR